MSLLIDFKVIIIVQTDNYNKNYLVGKVVIKCSSSDNNKMSKGLNYLIQYGKSMDINVAFNEKVHFNIW